jgi:penicillin-binding protein 2
MVVKYKFRLYLFSVVMLAGFFLLVFRLWSLQIDRHSDFVKMVRVGSELKARIPGVRGEIKDRNGITLATNRAIFEVRINLGEMMNEYSRLVILGQMGKAPVHEYEVLEKGIMRKRSEEDVAEIFKQTIVRRLEEMGLAKNFSADSMRVHYRTFKGVVPWVYRDDLTFAEFSRFAEHNLGLPGVTVAERAVRQYPFGSLACHLLGYVRLPEDQRVSPEERAEWDYYLPDDFGGTGVEKSFDDYLRGKPGVRTMKKDERGRLVGELSFEEPRKGNDVHLTIDARIQYIAEKALRDGGIGRGAVVVIEPGSGEVLAMASVPSYNPNKFIPSISTADYRAYLDNRVNPLFNRAVAPYAPGSTFKIPISFAGCLANIQMRRFNCAGGVNYGNKYMQCWIGQKGGAHGSLDLSDAIMRSCNCYFYQYGNAAGIDNITKACKMLGVGERTGIELEEEQSGVLPNPQWLQMNKPLERWSNGFTANTSIGQGFVLATPLQMASVVATVANGGKSFRPHLLKRVVNGTEVVLEKKPDARADMEKEGYTGQEIEMIRKGMWKVVNAPNGTAKSAQIKNVEVAGKTGTAQFWRVEKGQKSKDNHTWFISFAPYLNPKFAVCVLVQGGYSGGGTAAPVATRVMEQALALDNGYEVKIEPVAEVAGSFEPVVTVVYEAGPVLVAAVSEDEDLGPERESVSEVPTARPVARPSIRRDADAAGSVETGQAPKIPKAVPVRRAGLFNRGSEGAKPAPAPTDDKTQRKKGLLDRIFR